MRSICLLLVALASVSVIAQEQSQSLGEVARKLREKKQAAASQPSATTPKPEPREGVEGRAPAPGKPAAAAAKPAMPARTARQAQEAAQKPAVKVALAFLAAVRAKNVAKMKSYMSPEAVRQFDAMSAEQRQFAMDVFGAGTPTQVEGYEETGSRAKVTLGSGPGPKHISTALKLVLVEGAWKIGD